MNEPIIPARIRVPPPNGLRRARLDPLIGSSCLVPLTLVVAPAGSGKTTMLAMFAQTEREAGRAVAWYQAGSSEADPVRLLSYMEETVRQVVPSAPRGWLSVGTAAAALEAVPVPPLVIVIDDSHTLVSTAAEAALEQFVAYMPPQVHVVMAGRRPPAFDLPRWRLAGQIVEIGPDDLRFRSWEVEELFSQQYDVRLVPEEVAELARRTGGWAAGLSLFQLATANRPSSERRRVLSSLSSRLLDTRDYLTRNVLAALEESQREFLVRTCVLGRLSGPWCDQLLGTTGSARRLEDLARRHLFLLSHDGGATYQEHEVLRSFLEERLLDQVGEQGMRDLYAQAGTILEAGGAASEALRAYCRAQDWRAADRLLGLSGDRVVDPLSPWGDALPPAVADHDAWYQLATARRQVRSGHWTSALDSYRRGEEGAAGALVRRTCQRERFQLAGWMDPATTVPHDWTGVLRRALARNPLGVLEGAETRSPGDRLAGGLAALAAGHVGRAHAILAADTEDVQGPSVLQCWAEIARWLTARLSGLPYNNAAFQSCLDAVDPQLAPWLGRLLHAAVGTQAAFTESLEASRPEVMATENPWADLVFGVLEGFVSLAAGQGGTAVARFDKASAAALSLGTPVLAAWAKAGASLGSLATDPRDAAQRAASADKLARSVGCPGASALSVLVEAAARDDPNWRDAAAAIELDGVVPMAGFVAAVRTSPAIDIRSPRESQPVGPAQPAGQPSGEVLADVEVRCLGPFVLSVGGHLIDTGLARPRVRALLHYLAMLAGTYVHRDELYAALWSPDEARPGAHSLQVAVSALRQLLEAQAGTGAGGIIGRRGESYVLEAGGGFCDLAQFEANLRRGRSARRDARHSGAAVALRAAVALYRGDLLAEEGSVEWVLGRRDRYRLMASEASQLLAEVLLESGEAAEAAEVAGWGLANDRYCDGLWKVMIAAHDKGSNQAASARTRDDYRRVLAELGVGTGGASLGL